MDFIACPRRHQRRRSITSHHVRSSIGPCAHANPVGRWAKSTPPWRMLAVRAVRQTLVVPVSALVFVLGARAGRAEEGGTGHYVPGANASFIDALPGREGFAIANYFLYYPASAARQLPVAGLIAANLDATAFADSI